MDLTNTIEKAWNELSDAISQEAIRNPSAIAFKFCEAIRKALPSPGISYDNRDIPEDEYRPNLVIWEGDEQPKIAFLGRLIIGSSGLSEHREVSRLLAAIDQDQFEVLERNTETGSYIQIPMRFSEDLQFGLFVVDENGETKDLYQPLIQCVPEDRRDHFLFAQNYEVSNHISKFHRQDVSQTPNGITIKSGRVLYVDWLLIETKLAEWSLENHSESDLPLLVKRSRLDWEHDQWFDPEEVHFKLPEDLGDSEDFKNGALVSVILYSKPITANHGFSELMVVFYSPDIEDRNIRECLGEALNDLEWESLAIDRKGVINKLL